jgi:hypothetical protein
MNHIQLIHGSHSALMLNKCASEWKRHKFATGNLVCGIIVVYAFRSFIKIFFKVLQRLTIYIIRMSVLPFTHLLCRMARLHVLSGIHDVLCIVQGAGCRVVEISRDHNPTSESRTVLHSGDSNPWGSEVYSKCTSLEKEKRVSDTGIADIITIALMVQFVTFCSSDQNMFAIYNTPVTSNP